MLQDDESLALALRGGLRGRFQGTFNQLENAVEVLDDYMLQHLNPAEYADLRTMMREINWQLAYLRRLGDHAADAAAAPVLQMLRVPAPLELLSQLHETVELFNELTVGGTRAVHARLETAPGLDVFPTMGDPALLDGLLVNLFTNSIQAVPEPDAVEITLTCTQNQLLYRDNGPGLPQDARRLLLEGVWTSELLAKGGHRQHPASPPLVRERTPPLPFRPGGAFRHVISYWFHCNKSCVFSASRSCGRGRRCAFFISWLYFTAKLL